MSSGTFVDRIDPFAKRSLKKKPKKSQGSSRYRTGGDVELTALPLLKGKMRYQYYQFFCIMYIINQASFIIPDYRDNFNCNC